MSIRSLLSTTVSATEAAVLGTVKLGSVVGNTSDWLVRQSEQLNSAEAIKKEEIRRKVDYIKELKEMVGGDTAQEVKANIKEVEDLFDGIFK